MKPFIFTFAILLFSCHKNESGNSVMKINNNAIEKIEALKQKEKFKEDSTIFYPGAINEVTRASLNKLMNESIDEIVKVLNNKSSKENILEQYKVGLARFSSLNLDTEDRERVCKYYDEIREIIGFDSTENVLNDWLY